jgi:predicted LPLAT superfamily acyltransferase
MAPYDGRAVSFAPCAVIPTFNHMEALPAITARLRAQGLPVIIVDDGSGDPAASAIAALHDPHNQVTVHRHDANLGKGVTVCEGFRLAFECGYTHVLQVDADGQHDLAVIADLLARAEAHPDAVISGAPIYDESAPLGRKVGRWVTHLWVFLETLSFRITDSMCGLRVYPLAAVQRLLSQERVGARMDFDTDIMVRLFWRGVPPVMVPVKVVYPPGNRSNFDLLRDNLRISWMHARLVLTMLLRLRSILANRPRRIAGDTSHWAALIERGAVWGVAFVAAVYRLFGRRLCSAIMWPIVGFFYLTGTEQRQAARDYLRRVLLRKPGHRDGLRLHMDFANRAVDTFGAWIGAIPPTALSCDPPDALMRMAADPRGAVIVVSHHGNAEFSQAMLAPDMRGRLTVLVHTRHAENYNRILSKFRPTAGGRMLQVTEFDPQTAILLKERIEVGEWVAIAGDRVPVLSEGRVSRVPFLGDPADFSQGPWIIAALLECPVYLLFCRRESGERWRLSVELFADHVALPRGRREEALAEYAAAYARRLERECREAPWQWYNFFDFWAVRNKG